jgi:hypothetical protein
MSTLAVSRDYAAPLFVEGSKGSGTDSEQLAEILAERRQERRAAASAPQSLALDSLARIVRDCSVDGWDGHGGRRISARTESAARDLLESLPMWLPAPDIVPEADGDLGIEWDFGPDKIFSISVGEKGMLHFAGLFGGGVERHGVEPFSGMVSTEVLGHIKRLIDGITATYPRRAVASATAIQTTDITVDGRAIGDPRESRNLQ